MINLNYADGKKLEKNTVWVYVYEVLENANKSLQKVVKCLPGDGRNEGSRKGLQKGMRKLLGVMDVFTILIRLMVSWAHIYQTYETVHCKCSLFYVTSTLLKVLKHLFWK